MDNIIDLAARRDAKKEPEAIDYEIHFYPQIDQDAGRVERTRGHLKFGPQLIAVLSGPLDTDPVVFAVATQSVQFIKKIDEEGSVQGTLSL